MNLGGEEKDSVVVYSGSSEDLKGIVQIVRLKSIGNFLTFRFKNQIDTEVKVRAHDSQIEFLRLSSDGRYLATASEKGTLIRVFDIESLDDQKGGIKKVKEFRRGTSSKIIKDICFGFQN